MDDPTIMSWQIGNEPRAFSDENKEPFARWMADVAAQIKSLDPNHMVSSGSEGAWGCEMDMNLFEKIHADPNINYLNIHIWPYNWGWVKADSLTELLPRAKENTKKYIDDHMVIARKYSKPIVLEEFGFPVTVSASPKRHRPLPAMNITVMYSTSSARTVRAADSLPDATSGHGVVLPDKIPTMYSGKREMTIPVTRLKNNKD